MKWQFESVSRNHDFLKEGGILQGSTSVAITSANFSSVIDAVKAQISVTTVVEVLAYAAAIAVALVFMWWGVRKVSRIIMGAFRKGRLSL